MVDVHPVYISPLLTKLGESKVDSQLKVEDHAELSTVTSNSLDQLTLVVNTGHLSNTESIVLLEDSTDLLEELMTSGTTGVVLCSSENSLVRVGECWILADKVDNIHAEAIDATVKPEAHHMVDLLANRRVLPVKVWLLLTEDAEIVLICDFVILPGASYKL